MIMENEPFLLQMFFVLRKKFNQVSALHLYHHVSTLYIVWWGARTYPGEYIYELHGQLNYELNNKKVNREKVDQENIQAAAAKEISQSRRQLLPLTGESTPGTQHSVADFVLSNTIGLE